MDASRVQDTIKGRSPRIEWLDAARGYAIFLVFYGHLMQNIGSPENGASAFQEKLIYAFHMPLFVLISGFLAKTVFPPLRSFLKKQALTRLLPVLFFSAFLFPISLLHHALSGDRGPTEVEGRFFRNWEEICAHLAVSGEGETTPARHRLGELLTPEARFAVMAGVAGDSLTAAEREPIIRALNDLLDRPDLFGAEHFVAADLPTTARRQLEKNRMALTDNEELRHANWTLALWTLQPGSFYWRWHQSPWEGLGMGLLMTLKGYPMLNWITWFLICLFTIELIHFLVGRFLAGPVRVALAIPLFSVAGWFATIDVGMMEDFWFVRESILLYAFYLLGLLLRQSGILDLGRSRLYPLFLFVAGTAVLFLTFQLNPGAPVIKPIVLINLSQHGHPLYFAISAVAGCVAVVGLARLTPPFRLLTFLGCQSLVLMGLNGMFFRMGNPILVDMVTVSATQVSVTFWCAALTGVSLIFCLPFIWFLDRSLPQLVGKPRQKGPLLPALLKENG
ncbi:MAG: acyltransferase family protein [Gemmatimonadetes bacterium]|nr:acyltransferase family protein [Gemmatimonadota bacterium]